MNRTVLPRDVFFFFFFFSPPTVDVDDSLYLTCEAVAERECYS